MGVEDSGAATETLYASALASWPGAATAVLDLMPPGVDESAAAAVAVPPLTASECEALAPPQALPTADVPAWVEPVSLDAVASVVPPPAALEPASEAPGPLVDDPPKLALTPPTLPTELEPPNAVVPLLPLADFASLLVEPEVDDSEDTPPFCVLAEP